MLVLPVGAQQLNSLVHAFAAGIKVLVQRFIFRALPANPYPQTYAPARQRIQRTNLLGDQRGLALRQHQHTGSQINAGGNGRRIGKHHECLHDWHGRRVERRPASFCRVAHHDMIEHIEPVEANLFNGPNELLHTFRAFTVHNARKYHGNLHVTPRI